jgi:hypothetical protein
MEYIVYKTVNIVNGKYYIGVHKQKSDDSYIGCGIRFRKDVHSKHRRTDSHFTRAVKKYGFDKFKRETLFTFDNQEDAYKREAELVTDVLVNDQGCYNTALGGKGGQLVPSEVLRRSALKKFADRYDMTVEQYELEKKYIELDVQGYRELKAERRVEREAERKVEREYKSKLCQARVVLNKAVTDAKKLLKKLLSDLDRAVLDLDTMVVHTTLISLYHSFGWTLEQAAAKSNKKGYLLTGKLKLNKAEPTKVTLNSKERRLVYLKYYK